MPTKKLLPGKGCVPVDGKRVSFQGGGP